MMSKDYSIWIVATGQAQGAWCDHKSTAISKINSHVAARRKHKKRLATGPIATLRQSGPARRKFSLPIQAEKDDHSSTSNSPDWLDTTTRFDTCEYSR